MAKQTVIGPYRVKPLGGWTIVLMTDNQSNSYQELIPPRTYPKEKRTSAYRGVALLNRDWQEEHQFDENWPELFAYWQQATN